MSARLPRLTGVTTAIPLIAGLCFGGDPAGYAQPRPVAWYPFDDGTASDLSGNALHGVLNGNAQIVTNATRPSAPAANKVLSLDGLDLDAASSYVYLGTNALLDFSGGEATVAAWVFVNDTHPHNTIFSQGEWKQGASLTIKGDATNTLWAGGTSAGSSQRSDKAVPVGQWTHVAATWTVTGTNTQIAFYTNGVATGFTEGGSPMAGTLLGPVNGSAIGREWRDSAPADIRFIFNGLMDDVQLFNTALTPDQVAGLVSGTNEPPQILIVGPANGTTGYPTNGGVAFNVTTVGPNAVATTNIHLFLNGTDVTAGLAFSGSSTQRLASCSAPLQPNLAYTAQATAADNAGRTNARVWTFDTTNPPPQITIISPADGATCHPTNGGIAFIATSVSPNFIATSDVRLFLNGADVSGGLVFSGSSTQRLASYSAALQPNLFYTAQATAADNEGRTNSRTWSFDTADPAAIPPGTQLNLTVSASVRQSGDASPTNTAAMAIDGNLGTFSETPSATNSFWEMEFERPCAVARVELVPPSAGGYDGVANGLVLRILGAQDNTLLSATVSNVAPGGFWVTNLATPVDGRIVRIALENGRTNGAGDRRVALAEVRVFGDPSPEFGPVTLAGAASVVQSSTNGAYHAALAVDGAASTCTETLDLTNSYWQLTFNRPRPIQCVELVNRSDPANAARLQGLTVRILDDASNSIASATVPAVAAGNNWLYTAPPGTIGRYLKIGLENGATNGQGNRIVSLAEVSVLGATNLALRTPCYQVRLVDTLPPAANGNDGNYSTAISMRTSTVDGYWETDLGQPRAIYSVRAVAADGQQSRVAHCTVRLFNDAHDSVFSQHLSGSAETFDVAMPGPVLARFVRVGLENKERTSPTGGTEWTFGLKEVQAFGCSSNAVGLLAFSATQTQIVAGASTDLHWQETGLHALHLHPDIGSVGAQTGPAGAGTLTVSPTHSTEYVLVGTNQSDTFARCLTIEVNGQILPARISEFVANNKSSLRDGNKSYPDWIELHNPNNAALSLAGCGLSDDPAVPMKWVFPAGVTLPAHGYLVVFADDARQPYDDAGFLHAAFNLDQNGESVVLTASNGTTTVDSILGYPPQREDLAYGRTLDGGWGFLEPTPGAANIAATYEGWLQPLDFSHKRGWYTNAFSLTITNPNPDSQVLWSLDGTEPTHPYTGPLLITNTTGVRAQVMRSAYKSPRTKTHSYLFLDGILASSVMSTTYTQDPAYTGRLRQGLRDLPAVFVNVPPWPSTVNSDRDEHEASVEIFMPDGFNVQENCGFFHYGGAFGNGTGNPYAKKSWQMQFRAKYGASKLRFPLFNGFDHGILAREAYDEIDLHAGNQDMTGRGFYLSHRFAANTMLELGSLNPHGRFVHLYINGAYWGQYDAHERLTDGFLAEYLGGAKEDYLTVKGNDNGANNNFVLGTPDPPDWGPWETVRTNAASYAAVRDRLDVTNLIDFMLVWNWGNAEAEFRSAGARAPIAGGGFKFWLADADGQLRNQSGVAAALTRNATAITGPGLMFGALLAGGNPDFKTLLADRIYKAFFNNGPMTPAANEFRMNLLMNEITNSMVAECARWGFRTPATWQSDAQYARDQLLPYRNANLLNFMRSARWYPSVDAPQLSQYGGSVTNGYPLVISGSGTLYYTLDGSDPRLPGGSVASNAIAWNLGHNAQPIRLPPGSVWRWRKGTNEVSSPATAWRTNGFNDAAWPTNAAPLQYGYSGGTALDDMRSNYTCVFLRQTFVVSNVTDVTALRLAVNYDDGFVAWINGTEVARNGVTNNPIACTNTATINHEASATETFTNHSPQSLLVNGTNTLAVQAFNRSLSASTDFYFDLGLDGDVINTNSPFPMLVTNATSISARAWDGTNWSALAQTTFVIAPLVQPAVGDLVFSEINCNPDGSDDYQFVELDNLSSNLLDLTGVKLADGVDFLFPNGFRLGPGGFALVVENAAAFDQRYRTNVSPYYYPDLLVAGEWVGKLAHAGERISLLASNGIELAGVSFAAGGFWPSRADGKGSSLELRNPSATASTNLSALNASLDRGINWRSSPRFNGSPGRLDSEPRELVINEVVSHTDMGVDWVELRNTTPNPVSLTNACLSDQYDLPFRYVFPTNTAIPGNSFLLLSATNLGFGFSELGSDILVVEASGTNILRFLDTVDFPAVTREEPFGRYARSDGIVDFTELRAKTPSADNALPRVGPVVFSEIMYHPTNENSEYIELVNLGATNVPLYDPGRPTNTWQLSDGIDFTFPTNQLLAPGAVAIVCATNPEAFRAQYGVGPDIPVYGPWTGALNNAGEAVNLRRPGDPETSGYVPYYRVDRVRYEPLPPWPVEADTGGVSLERAPVESYGNDPIDWQPSPPGGTPGSFVANRQPMLSVDGNSNVMEGEVVTLNVQATDLDQPWQAVALSAEGLPAGSSFDPDTGTFSWATGEADGPGTNLFQFIATDNGAIPTACTQTVAVTVLESNRTPTLQPIPDLLYGLKVPLVISVAASDPDLPPQPLQFSASGLPPDLVINVTNGQITGSAQTAGVFPVVVSVSDGQSPPLGASNGFALTIAAANLTVTAADSNKVYGANLALDGRAFTISGTLFDGDTLTNVTLTSAGTPGSARIGHYPITPSGAQGVGLTRYSISYSNGTLTISPADLLVRAANSNKMQGTSLGLDRRAFTVNGTLFNGDTLTNVTLTSAGAAVGAPAGSYPIIASAAQGAGLTNYSIAYSNGTLVVLAPFNIEWTPSGTNGRPQFFFQALPGATYEIRYTYQLESPDWQLLQRIEQAAGGLQPIPDPPDPDAAHCFLRVVWIPENP